MNKNFLLDLSLSKVFPTPWYHAFNLWRGRDVRPRARFDAVAPKLLSALLAPSRLLAGPAALAFESLPIRSDIHSHHSWQ